MTRNGQRLLLLIDDEPAQRRLVSALAARAGWRSIFAADGEMALAQLGTQDGMQLDAILLDHWAPDADAGPLIAELRERRPALPILMLTANGSVAHAVAAMRAGATDFLVKPLAPERLLAALEACMTLHSFKAGERIFARGDAGDELYLIRRGAVRILLPLGTEEAHHLATFGRGSFFGEMAFLDQDPRSADAIAHTDTDLFALSRKSFDAFAEEHKKVANNLLEGLARTLAIRLRYTDAELRALQA